MKKILPIIFVFLYLSLSAQEELLNDGAFTEAEFHVAINPTDSSNIILVTMYGFGAEGGDNLLIYYTHDFGATWSQSDFHGNLFSSSPAGDPVVAFDAEGRAELVNLTITEDDVIYAILSTSMDGGASWVHSINVVDTFCDKPWMAIDRFDSSPNKGNIYIPIVIDHLELFVIGEDYSPIDTLNIPDGDHIPSVVVSKDGDVFTSSITLGADHTIFVQKYTDGGTSLSHSTPVATFPSYIFDVPDISDRFQPTPYLSIDNSDGPYSGRLYLSYTASELENPNYFDVFLTYSDDDGLTWSVPRQVHSDGLSEVQQFYSSTFVNDQGILVMDWYDRRDYPDSTHLTDFYLGVSYDGGETISELKLNSIPSDFDQVVTAGNAFGIGEYHQLVASDNYVISFWSDGRTNDEDLNIYFAKVDLNNPVAVEEIGLLSDKIAVSDIYPQPITGTEVYFDVNLEETANLKFMISDIEGRIVSEKNWETFPAGKHVLSVSSGLIVPGIYSLTIMADSGYWKSMKFIKK